MYDLSNGVKQVGFILYQTLYVKDILCSWTEIASDSNVWYTVSSFDPFIWANKKVFDYICLKELAINIRTNI